MKCRHCNSELKLSLVDLGSAPLSNAYLTRDTLSIQEKWFPLRVLVCEQCWLVQAEDFTDVEELFDADYAYFSSYSKSWLKHCENYVGAMVDRFKLTEQSHVVEVAANDGYLLQYVKKLGIPCTGIEPTASTAEVARGKGITVIQSFFSSKLAGLLVEKGQQADLMVANNVLAHVPDINDFVSAFAVLLKPDGVATFEFPHVLKLIEQCQFDTIYHEHFSYLSLTTVEKIFSQNGLKIFDVDELSMHGESLRVYTQCENGTHKVNDRVYSLLKQESEKGISSALFYTGFQQRVDALKNNFLSFLLEARSEGKSVAAYGAAAKGNTLMNYAGVRPDLIPFVVDRNPNKQGKFIPGRRIPIVDEVCLKKVKPDYIIILPWNLRDEIALQLGYTRSWGGMFVTAVPELKVW